MNLCYLCKDEITKSNQTNEHIILNALGGRLKSKKLICRNCNSKYGYQNDQVLAKQLNIFTNLLKIEREDGIAQPISGKHPKTGEEFRIQASGVPTLARPKIEKSEGEESINISARNIPEFRKILEGLKRKNYPDLDIDKAVSYAKLNKEPLDSPLEIKLNVGGDASFRSILKSAVNYFIYCGGQVEYVEHLISALKEEVEPEMVWFYYPENNENETDRESIFHRIYLKADPTDKSAFCFIDFFGGISFIIGLNFDYAGQYISSDYKFNLRTLKRESINFHLSLAKDEILDHLQNKPSMVTHLQSALTHLLSIAKKMSHEKRMDNILNEAVNSVLGKYPDGTPVTEEMIKEFSDKLSTDIAIYLSQHSSFADQ